MALSIALPLSGLEAEHFYALGVRFLYEQGLRTLNGIGEPISPSIASESSGVSSLTPSVESATNESSPTTSRPSTPIVEKDRKTSQNIEEKTNVPIRVFYKERDILNLGANIREPLWLMRSPIMPRYNFRSFMANRSIYYRLGENGLTEDYPTRHCKECGFNEPSPFIC